MRCTTSGNADAPTPGSTWRRWIRAVELFESQPDFCDTLFSVPDPRNAAVLTGKTGILLLAWRLAPSDDLVERLERSVRENADNDADEVMWGRRGRCLPRRRCSGGRAMTWETPLG